jgi:hypothetical protein
MPYPRYDPHNPPDILSEEMGIVLPQIQEMDVAALQRPQGEGGGVGVMRDVSRRGGTRVVRD